MSDDLLQQYKDKILPKEDKDSKRKKAAKEALDYLEEKGIIKKLSKEELNQRIKDGVPGTYFYDGITHQIGGANPFEPDDNDIF